jgi:hypothetical protein
LPAENFEIDPLYPRPQLRRARWLDLCGQWGFAHDDEDRGIAEGWFDDTRPFTRTIEVPYPPESELSGIAEPGFHPVVWYRREFDVPAGETRDTRLMLHFGAVDYEAMVWVNGKLACTHSGGHTPFFAEIGHLLLPGTRQAITVRAKDDPFDLQQPRGKQYWEEQPGYIWYNRTTGIWQPVWLEPLPPVAIREIRWTPDADKMGVGLVLRLDGEPRDGCRVRIRLMREKTRDVLVDDTCLLNGSELRREFLINISQSALRKRMRLLWSPEDPNLIAAEIEVIDMQDRVVDRVESYFGLRRIELDNGYFILNGIPIFLRLVLAQNYWPQSHLAAPSHEALKREVELARELGFNGIRIHQKVEDPRFLYWCDRLGMLVWGEMANAYVYSDQAAEMLLKEWIDVLRRDYNHPSIVTWVPLNESWGVPDLDRSAQQRAFVQALYSLTKSLDPTRPVIGNDGWQHAVGDIFGIHDYSGNAATLLERYGDRNAIDRTMREVWPQHHPLLGEGVIRSEQPIIISEYGGLSYRPEEDAEWFGYGQFETAEALLDHYSKLTAALLQSTALAGYCYTQLTDTEQETNGLLTADRQPKLDPKLVRAVNTRPSCAVQSEILDALIMQEVELRRRRRES